MLLRAAATCAIRLAVSIGAAVSGTTIAPTIVRADPPPAFLFAWGSYGTGNGQFDTPTSVAVDGSGNVYVNDSGNHRIEKFTSSGAFVTSWDFGAALYGDIAVDGSSRVYVVPTFNDVTWFTGDGNVAGGWSCSTFCPHPEDGCPDVCDLMGVAPDAIGGFYVTSKAGNLVRRVSSTGESTSLWGSSGSGDGQFSSPTGVALDGGGGVYIADSGNHRIQKFSSTGTFLTQWGSPGSGVAQFNSPSGVAVDGSGGVYVADTGNHRIEKFTGTGTYLTEWGSVGSGDGQFNFPTSVAVDGSGDVYVADSGNHRIQKFGRCLRGEQLPDCRIAGPATLLFGAYYSTDADWIPMPLEEPYVYDSTRVSVTKTTGDVFYLSGAPDALTGWICDDHFDVNELDTGSGFSLSTDPPWPVCVPIEQVHSPVPPRDITTYLPDGTHCVTFRIVDLGRKILGNTAIYLVKSSSVGMQQPVGHPAFRLLAPTPNPARAATVIAGELSETRRMDVIVLDANGRVVRFVARNRELGPGLWSLRWDGRDEGGALVPNGVYLLRATSGSASLTQRVAIIR